MKSKYQHHKKAAAYFTKPLPRMALRGLYIFFVLLVLFAGVFTGTMVYILVLLIVGGVTAGFLLTRKLNRIKKKLVASGRIGRNALVYSCSPLYSIRTHILVVDSEKITAWDWSEALLFQIPNADISALEWGNGPQLAQIKLVTEEKIPITFQLTKRVYNTVLGLKPKAKGEKIAVAAGAVGAVVAGPNIASAVVSTVGSLQALSGLAQLCELANIKEHSSNHKLDDKTGRITLITLLLMALLIVFGAYILSAFGY